MPGQSRTFLAKPRVERFLGVAVPVVGAVPILLWCGSMLFAPGAQFREGRLSGDYPAFYAAGRLVMQGRVNDIYDGDAHLQAQSDLFPADGKKRYLVFAYPPHVAGAYSALALMPYQTSYAVHTVFMALCLLIAVAMLRQMRPGKRSTGWLFCAALCMFPTFEAVRGGQNTTLVLLCFVGAAYGCKRGHYGLAGVLCAVALYKPQLALPVFSLLLVTSRSVRLFAGFLMGVAGI